MPIGESPRRERIVPGMGEKVDRRDRRGADQGEPGLGPGKGLKWKGIETGKGGVKLKYAKTRLGIPVVESWTGTRRTIETAPLTKDLTVHFTDGKSFTFKAAAKPGRITYNYTSSGNDPDPEETEVSILWISYCENLCQAGGDG